MTVLRMRIAYWIPKTTNTLTICNPHCFSTTTVVGRTRLNVMLYVQYIACLVGKVNMELQLDATITVLLISNHGDQ
jgi:hypothetical protein